MLRKRVEATGIRPQHAVMAAVLHVAGSVWLLRSGYPISLPIILIVIPSCAVSLLLVWKAPLGDTARLVLSGALVGLLMTVLMQADLYGLRVVESELAVLDEPPAGSGMNPAVALGDPSQSARSDAGGGNFTRSVQIDGGMMINVSGSKTSRWDGATRVVHLSWYAWSGGARRYCGTTSAAAQDDAAATALLEQLIEDTVSGRRATRNPCNQHAKPW